MRFPGVFFLCEVGRLVPLTHAVTHTGIGRCLLGVRYAGFSVCGLPYLLSVALSLPQHERTKAPRWRSAGLGESLLHPASQGQISPDVVMAPVEKGLANPRRES